MCVSHGRCAFFFSFPGARFKVLENKILSNTFSFVPYCVCNFLVQQPFEITTQTEVECVHNACLSWMDCFRTFPNRNSKKWWCSLAHRPSPAGSKLNPIHIMTKLCSPILQILTVLRLPFTWIPTAFYFNSDCLYWNSDCILLEFQTAFDWNSDRVSSSADPGSAGGRPSRHTKEYENSRNPIRVFSGRVFTKGL